MASHAVTSLQLTGFDGKGILEAQFKQSNNRNERDERNNQAPVSCDNGGAWLVWASIAFHRLRGRTALNLSNVLGLSDQDENKDQG